MELFITSRSALTKPLDEAEIPDIDGKPYSLPTAARDALDQLSIPDGMPFVLDATGEFEPMLSKFMLDLPSAAPETKIAEILKLRVRRQLDCSAVAGRSFF